MSDSKTQGIRVQVESRYVEEQSQPQARKFVFTYTVRIANEGDKPAKLVSRHWIITDGLGREEHVRGPGVIGKQPLLKPGEVHEYASFCPLLTPHGTMRGTYRMERPDGTQFDADIAPFVLARPNSLN